MKTPDTTKLNQELQRALARKHHYLNQGVIGVVAHDERQMIYVPGKEGLIYVCFEKPLRERGNVTEWPVNRLAPNVSLIYGFPVGLTVNGYLEADYG